MRFYEEHNGFIWEHDSFWHYVKCRFADFLGTIIFYVICILAFFIFCLIVTILGYLCRYYETRKDL